MWIHPSLLKLQNLIQLFEKTMGGHPAFNRIVETKIDQDYSIGKIFQNLTCT
jgi:hypothetical protein